MRCSDFALLKSKKLFLINYLKRISKTKRYVIEAEGNTLAFSNMNFGVERLSGKVSPEKLKKLIDDAVRLYEFFKSGRN